MNLLTVKLPEPLDEALSQAAQREGVTKSAIARRALEQALLPASQARGAGWASRWHGVLAGKDVDAGRLAHLQREHLR
jgi:predicted transcriptional regulator